VQLFSTWNCREILHNNSFEGDMTIRAGHNLMTIAPKMSDHYLWYNIEVNWAMPECSRNGGFFVSASCWSKWEQLAATEGDAIPQKPLEQSLNLQDSLTHNPDVSKWATETIASFLCEGKTCAMEFRSSQTVTPWSKYVVSISQKKDSRLWRQCTYLISFHLDLSHGYYLITDSFTQCRSPEVYSRWMFKKRGFSLLCESVMDP
jgi:hypothetical protein